MLRVFLVCWLCAVGGALVTGTAFAPPSGWREAQQADLHAVTKDVAFVLPVQNEEMLTYYANAVSTPGNVFYGRHLTQEQVDELFVPRGPPAALVQYTASLGWDCSYAHGVYTCAGVPAAVIEQEWDVRFRTFQSTKGKVVTRATEGPELPEPIRPLVSMVAGLGATVPVRSVKARPATANANDPNILPQTLRAVYSIPDDLDLTPAVSIGAVEYQNDAAFRRSDLQQQAEGLNTPFCYPDHVVGPFYNETADDESALDAGVIAGLACGAELHWLTFSDWIWDFAHFCASNSSQCPNITSHSWGWCGRRSCDVDSAGCDRWNVNSTQYNTRVDLEIAKSVCMGKTILCASGDSGCHGRSDINCASEQCCAVYPCASPYVTCVSASAAVYGSGTPFANPPPACVNASAPCAASVAEGPCFPHAPHTGCFWTPGGTIAFYGTRPEYQQKAVKDFLSANSSDLPPSSVYGHGRGVPDVTALGHCLLIVDNGQFVCADGTSASTPVVAALMAFVTQARLNARLPRLGLVNPLLYSLAGDARVFHKIRHANNSCTEAECCDTGFVSSDTAWDPDTGLGTLNTTAFIHVAVQDGQVWDLDEIAAMNAWRKLMGPERAADFAVELQWLAFWALHAGSASA